MWYCRPRRPALPSLTGAHCKGRPRRSGRARPPRSCGLVAPGGRNVTNNGRKDFAFFVLPTRLEGLVLRVPYSVKKLYVRALKLPLSQLHMRFKIMNFKIPASVIKVVCNLFDEFKKAMSCKICSEKICPKILKQKNTWSGKSGCR